MKKKLITVILALGACAGLLIRHPAGPFITLALILAGLVLTLVREGRKAGPQTAVITDLNTRLNELLNDIGSENLDTTVLGDIYVKSIKLFQTLVTDKETGAINEKHFKSLFQTEVNRTVRYGKSFSLLIIKVRNASEFAEGQNALLKRIAGIIRSFMRDVDILGRFREEFLALLLPETGIKGAQTVGERVLSRVRKETDQEGRPQDLLLSIGISVCPLNGKNVDVLLNEAEKNIANADRLGGNQVIFSAG